MGLDDKSLIKRRRQQRMELDGSIGIRSKVDIYFNEEIVAYFRPIYPSGINFEKSPPTPSLFICCPQERKKSL